MDLQLCLIIPCVVLGLCVVYAQGQGQVDACLSSPCYRGTCSATAAGGFKCTCDTPGNWRGTLCRFSRCPTRNKCLNNGKCVTQPLRQWRCACKKGYGGARCETKLVHCLSSPCQNMGTCQEQEGVGYTCDCAGTGFNGTNCETAVVAQSGNSAKSAGSIGGIYGLNQNHGSHGQEMNSLTMLVATFITLCAARFLL